MTEYLRSEKDRRDAILNDRPDTKFYFESQKFSDIPEHRRPPVNNKILGIDVQSHAAGTKKVRDNDHLIEDAAKRYSIDPDIVRAIIYTEASRGSLYGEPAQALGLAKTLYPANIDPSWQPIIPGSHVENPKDNIDLATLLISRIAKRLDDPRIEDIYSLYNSLSHDRTYVNKETKSTPYFAKLAMEAKAWEKKDWSAPELPSAKDTEDLRSGRQDSFNDRFGVWASSPTSISPKTLSDGPALPDDRYGSWGSVRWPEESSPVLRELRKYKRSMAPDVPGVSTAAADLDTPTEALRPNPGSGASSAMPARYLSGRITARPDAAPFDAGAVAAPLVPSDEIFPRGRPASFDDRIGNWMVSPSVTVPRDPSRLGASTLPGLVSGKPMDYSLLPSIFGLQEATRPDDEDWLLQLLAPRCGR